ncbi:MAG: hypothetical protein PHR68_01605 [Candidatus Gracilibacteria bacterium]|nr:hypothetical protein [Candidatus Gracilibacteria bacterium]
MGKIAEKIVSHFSLNGITFASTIEVDGKVLFTETHTDAITLATIASEKFLEKGYVVDENTVFSIQNGSVYKNGKLIYMRNFSIPVHQPFSMLYYGDMFTNNVKNKN